MAKFIIEKVNLDMPKNLKKINNDKFWTFSASTWWKLYTPYVPMRSGALFQQVKVTPKTITHTVPYANRIYNGNFNFRTDKHPNASRLWDVAAKSARQNIKLIKSMQNYIDSGRLEL